DYHGRRIDERLAVSALQNWRTRVPNEAIATILANGKSTVEREPRRRARIPANIVQELLLVVGDDAARHDTIVIERSEFAEVEHWLRHDLDRCKIFEIEIGAADPRPIEMIATPEINPDQTALAAFHRGKR